MHIRKADVVRSGVESDAVARDGSCAVLRQAFASLLCLVALTVAFSGCSNGGGGSSPSLVVDTLLDNDAAPVDALTLRDALAKAHGGQSIVFDASLDGGTLELSIVGEEHTILKGEVMGIRNEPDRKSVV